MIQKYKLILFALFMAYPLLAGTTPTLNVVATPFSPFVIEQDGELEGFSVDLFKRIADICRLNYSITVENSIPQMYDTVGEKKADVAIGGYPMTLKYEKSVDYTYPVFKSGSVVLSLKENHNSILGKYLGHFIGSLINMDVLKVIGFLFILLFISSNMVWFAERKNNPTMFPNNYLQGIWESFWWSSVTITTVGYGDKTPKSLVGRMCALVWMFSGIFVISYFTASISSSQTVKKLDNRYNTPHDLIGKQVGSVNGNTVSRYLKILGVRVFEFDSIDTAYKALNKKLITAVVFDAPVLKYHVKRDTKDRYVIGNTIFKEKYYGFVVPEESNYKEKINQAIIFLQETGEYELIYEKWFGH
jgi:polar amino acid transport system substrate-binding protein